MRTRIALGAAASLAALVCIIKKSPARLTRRAVSSGVIVAAVLAGAVLGPTMASAHHGSATRHRERAAASVDHALMFSLAAAYGRTPAGLRWLAEWKATHPAAPPPPPPPPPAIVLNDWNSTTTPDWACIRLHESGDRYNSPTAPGGAYGFLEGTWLSLGYTGWPYQAPAWVQDQAVLFLHAELGWQPWSTRFVCGL